MTEHDKDRIAFEACGYTNLWFDGHNGGWRCRELHLEVLAPWSSTDAAIAHAERGGFNWHVGKRTDGKGSGYGAGVWRDGDVEESYGEWSDSPGLAIRNAIVAWAEGNGKAVH